MEFLISTKNGLYKTNEKGEISKVCCDFEIQDAIIDKELYICSPTDGFIINDKKIVEEGCWRLWKYEGKIFALVEGPKIYEKENLVLDLTKYANEMNWYFPHGPPHITDIINFKGKIIATVEEGNLLVGDNITNLRPIKFSNDMHNLLKKGDSLLIACADGIYITKDLETFRKVQKGYFHALEDLGNLIVASALSRTPIYIGDGYNWKNVNIELPKSTFGSTNIAKLDDRRILYSSTSVYEIDILKEIKNQIIKEIPETRRISRL
ncbi:hypothetical protein [Acidianus manzaensis]|uniref:Uncharacterized protein n=1 Tax=Acidianus manzaensis TaxID=282676 RepID=A0A1W6JYX8_9CREN|nr:hypothetical protein [Acidianus manzaensis]ARM75483.1 hypothetical protein B6F84_05180 [Acidianus manzaensis]